MTILCVILYILGWIQTSLDLDELGYGPRKNVIWAGSIWPILAVVHLYGKIFED